MGQKNGTQRHIAVRREEGRVSSAPKHHFVHNFHRYLQLSRYIFLCKDQTVQMAFEDKQIIRDLGLEQYFRDCLRTGFQNWESLCNIAEAQLAAINFRLGHRRKLQREIARRRLQCPDHKLCQQHSNCNSRYRVHLEIVSGSILNYLTRRSKSLVAMPSNPQSRFGLNFQTSGWIRPQASGLLVTPMFGLARHLQIFQRPD
jgi:hypothetical protein